MADSPNFGSPAPSTSGLVLTPQKASLYNVECSDDEEDEEYQSSKEELEQEEDSEDTIAQRLRSKVSLSNVLLKELKGTLPKFTPDLCDRSWPDDPEWADFLKNLFTDGANLNEIFDDEKNDPDFDFFKELQKAEREAGMEEFRQGNAVLVPKKEINGLVKDLWKGRVDPAKYVAETESLEKPSTSSATSAAVQSSGFLPPVTMTPSSSRVLMAHFVQISNENETQKAGGGSSSDFPAIVTLPLFTPYIFAQIQDQMRKHVQLLAQVHVQSVTQTRTRYLSNEARKFLGELYMLGTTDESSSTSGGDPANKYRCTSSLFHPPNLRDALMLTDMVILPDNQKLQDKLKETLVCGKLFTGRGFDKSSLTYEQMEVLVSHKLFMFPQLLPDCKAVPTILRKKARISFTEHEDNLLALALEQYAHGNLRNYETTKYRTVSHNALPLKSPKQLKSRVKNIKNGHTAADNVLKIYLKTGKLSDLPRYSELEDYNVTVAPLYRSQDLLPNWFPFFLAIRREKDQILKNQSEKKSSPKKNEIDKHRPPIPIAPKGGQPITLAVASPPALNSQSHVVHTNVAVSPSHADSTIALQAISPSNTGSPVALQPVVSQPTPFGPITITFQPLRQPPPSVVDSSPTIRIYPPSQADSTSYDSLVEIAAAEMIPRPKMYVISRKRSGESGSTVATNLAKKKLKLDSLSPKSEVTPDGSDTESADSGNNDEQDDDDTDEEHLAQLMAASKTINYDPHSWGATQQGPRTKCQIKREKDEKDISYARGYLRRVQSEFEDQPEKYEEFLQLLRSFSENKQSVIKLYKDICDLLDEHKDLIHDFSAFLLPEQAVKCGCFAEYCSYQKAKILLSKLEEFFKTKPDQLKLVMKMIAQWDKLPADAKRPKALEDAIKPMLGSNKMLLEDFMSFFFAPSEVADRYLPKFEDFDLKGSNEGNEEGHDYEEEVLGAAILEAANQLEEEDSTDDEEEVEEDDDHDDDDEELMETAMLEQGSDTEEATETDDYEEEDQKFTKDEDSKDRVSLASSSAVETIDRSSRESQGGSVHTLDSASINSASNASPGTKEFKSSPVGPTDFSDMKMSLNQMTDD